MDTGSTVSEATERQRGGDRAFRWAAAFVVLLAVVLRVYDLDLKPFHHDEGVNGFFLTNLFRQGVYKYDPSNYHGPSLYYAAFVSAFLFGLNNIVVRLVTVFFGFLAVVLCLGTRRWLGDIAALAAALFLAVSPGMIFYSRYFIHEMLLIAATLGVVVAAQRFAETARLGDLLAAATWASWMFATKETALPTTIVLVVAVGCAWLYYRLRRPRDGWRPPLAFLGLAPRERGMFLICAAALFGVINLLLYSSFFTNPEGILSAIKTLGFWAQTGRTAHVHPWWQYLDWLWRAETPLVVIGALGLLLALWRAENRFVVFVAAWTVGVLAMYSVTPYKTPWLTINIVLPLALLAGYTVEVVVRHRLAWLGALIVLAASTTALRQSIDLNFVHYDDDSRPYVYAHTRRAFLDLIATVDRVAKLSGQGENARIAVPAKEHWPLPWYLRRYHNAAWEDVAENSRASEIVIGGLDQDATLAASLGTSFDRLGPFALRPGVDLVLFVRKGLASRPAVVTP
jgi:uncharacterized protein (TIGR03663 family)